MHFSLPPGEICQFFPYMSHDMPDRMPLAGKVAARAAFLLCLAHSGNVTIAAEFAGASRASLYNWRTQSDVFRAQWDEALLEAADRLGNIAWQRAVKGVEMPVFYQGEQIGSRQIFSDRLLVYLLSYARQNKKQADSVKMPDQDSLYAEFEAKLAALIGTDKR